MAKSTHPQGEGPYGLGRLLTGGGRNDTPVVSVGFQDPHRVVEDVRGQFASNGMRYSDYVTACGLTGRHFPFAPSTGFFSSVHHWMAVHFVCRECWSDLPGTPAARAKK